MDRTPARDGWLNSRWTLILAWALNRLWGATLEGLSGWIRTDWRAAHAQDRARTDCCSVTRTTAEDDLDGSHQDTVPP